MTTAAGAIWRDYDQGGLDAQYNNRQRFPDFVERFAAWADWSAATLEKIPGRLDVAFGDQAMERLDVFPADRKCAPIHVFIHGGYWYSLDKNDYSYVAQGMAPNGVTTVVNNYSLAPHADMDEIVRQNRAAVAWAWRNATDFGGDPSRLYVSGHSAGGHLAALMLATDWPAFGAGLPPDLVKGACAISGVFELEPIRLSYLNETLKMTPEMAARHSPALLDYPRSAPLFIVVGDDESVEYHRQSDAMAARWRALGYPCDHIVPEGLDHFAIVDTLIDPEADLTRRLLAAMPW
ncbi:MAG: alpha/beta hydrolase [Alphaproteobacteria bacterium]